MLPALLNSRRRFTGSQSAPYSIPAGWRHVEWSLDAAGIARVFINGILRATGDATTTGSATVTPGSGPMYIARYSIPDGGSFAGRVENYRMTRGSSVRHTANFNPDPGDFGAANDPRWGDVVAALPFDGANGSTTFTDLIRGPWGRAGAPVIDTGNYLAGTASGLFVAGDYISTPNDATTTLTQPFTHDCWIYKVPYGSHDTFWQNGQQAGVHAGCTIDILADGTITWSAYRNGSSLAFSLNTGGP